MQRFPFQSWLNYNPLLPASDKWSTPLNSPHHDDFKKVWFVGWLTTARATPSTGESVCSAHLVYYIGTGLKLVWVVEIGKMEVKGPKEK